MTLLLALANDSYSVVLGDRRLVCNGAVCEDESNKVCVLFCNDARIAIAYTGVAVYRKFRTQDWLRDTLQEISKDTQTIDEILAELQAQASATFAPLPVASRHIAFLISGYRYSAGGAEHVCYMLSNFDPDAGQPNAGRSLEFYRLGDPAKVIVEAAGFKSVLTDDDYSALREILESPASPQSVLHKAVGILQRVSRESASRRMIGSQCNSAVVPVAPDTVITSTYHSARAASVVHGPDIVVAVAKCGGAFTGMKMGAEGVILAGPDIRKNQECWCGSGEKFRTCHLKKFGSVYTRLPGFRKPMAMVANIWKEEPELSGRVYCVASSFT